VVIESASFFFQAEDGIRDFHVTGVQTCALPILVNVSGVGRQTPTTSAGVIVRNGLLLKSGPDIFLIENGHKRHIINLDAFTGKRSEEHRVGKEWRTRAPPER